MSRNSLIHEAAAAEDGKAASEAGVEEPRQGRDLREQEEVEDMSSLERTVGRCMSSCDRSYL